MWTQLDIILPVQHFGPRRKQAPEHRLMMAILHDAVECLEKYRFATDTLHQRLFHEAEQWLLADETDWLYSFESICVVLDLNADAVRRRLRVGTRRPDEIALRQLIPPGHGPGTEVHANQPATA